METGIEKAVRLAGSQTALAKLAGVSPQAVQKWVDQGYAPGGKCRLIEAKMNSQVTRYELNPEIFGEAADAVPLPTVAAKRSSNADKKQ